MHHVRQSVSSVVRARELNPQAYVLWRQKKIPNTLPAVRRARNIIFVAGKMVPFADSLGRAAADRRHRRWAVVVARLFFTSSSHAGHIHCHRRRVVAATRWNDIAAAGKSVCSVSVATRNRHVSWSLPYVRVSRALQLGRLVPIRPGTGGLVT